MNEYTIQIDPVTDGLASQAGMQPNWAGIVLSMTVFGVILLFVVRQMFGSGPFKEGFAAFKRLPITARTAGVALLMMAIVYGGTKPGTNEMEQASSPPVVLLRSPDLMASESAAVQFTESQQLAGFALAAVVTNDSFDFSAPTNAVVHDAWRKRGASEDGFWAALDGFPLGTNRRDAVYVSSSGTLSFNRPKSSPSARPMPDGSSIDFLAPLQTLLGIPPQSRWQQISNFEFQISNSLFWSDVTDSGSTRFTWQNALLDRATNAPVSFQAELFPDGDFIFRYDFTSLAASRWPLAPDYVIGAQNAVGGETALIATDAHACSATNHLCALLYSLEGTNVLTMPLCAVVTNSPKFSLRWTAFGDYDPADPDPDDDGVATPDEVLLHHTNPSMPDTDLDGVSDADETAAGCDPLNPDSDGDGLPDGADPAPVAWNDPEGDSDGDGIPLADELLNGFDPATNDAGATNGFHVTISVAAPSPAAPVLVAVGDRVMVFPASTPVGTSRTLWLEEGVDYPVTLYAAANTAISLTATLSSEWAAFRHPHPVFIRLGNLSGGRTVSSGVIVLPIVAISPDPLCFHSREDIHAVTSVQPEGTPGDWRWWMGFEPWLGTGREVVLPYDDADNPTYLSYEFQTAGASQPRSIFRLVTRCSLLDSHPDWLEPGNVDSPREPPHERYHDGDPITGEPIQYDTELEETGDLPGVLVPVNNDDDDASGSGDSVEEDLVIADNDLVAYYPLGRYNGNCCPCPEHQPQGPALSATLQSASSRLALWRDANKNEPFSGTVFAGEAIYVEGLEKSPSPGAEAVAWAYMEGNQSRVFTNAFTVLSQRLLPDLDSDGDVDEQDQAAIGSLDSSFGWIMPAVSNAFRKVQLRTDVDLAGLHVLTLSTGDAFRVWRTASPGPNDVPLLVGGQSATNGLGGVFWEIDYPDAVYLEAVGGGTATLTYAFLGTGTASRVVSRASLKMTVPAVTFVSLYDTFNPANRIFNPTPKDDPPAIPTNKLYLVESPDLSCYQAGLEIASNPPEALSRMVAAVYYDGEKIQGSDTLFLPSGEATLVFDDASLVDGITDYSVKVGLDYNGNNALDDNEILPGFMVKHPTTGTVIGPPVIRGSDGAKYTESLAALVAGGNLNSWNTPYASALLQIFMDGNTNGVSGSKLPTSVATSSFNAFGGYLSEWLTHNAGAPFNAAGVTEMTEYQWDDTTDFSDLVAESPQIEDPVTEYYETVVYHQATNVFENLPVGSVVYFPEDADGDSVQHASLSPSWVSGSTVEFNAGSLVPAPLDDLFSAIARARIKEHKVRYTVEKQHSSLWGTRLVVTGVESWGEIEDLYDFNQEAGQLSEWGATVQLGFGNGSKPAYRSKGQIYRTRIIFNKTYEELP